MRGRLLFRHLLHPRWQPRFTKFITALQGLEDSNILLEHDDVWSCQTPNHNRPEKGGADGSPQPFSKSLLRNVLVEYALLVSQSLGEDFPSAALLEYKNHRKAFTLDVYRWQTNRSNWLYPPGIYLGGLKIPKH